MSIAYAGIAEEYVSKSLFKLAQAYYEKGMVVCEDIQDKNEIARMCRGLERVNIALHDHEIAAVYAKRAMSIEEELKNSIHGGIEAIAR